MLSRTTYVCGSLVTDRETVRSLDIGCYPECWNQSGGDLGKLARNCDLNVHQYTSVE
jgi:hypothetical protein